MLTKINTSSSGYPANILNTITGGAKGASLCGRLYLYHKYISQRNVLVNFLMAAIDGLEADHCENAARHWRAGFKWGRIKTFPAKYSRYMNVRGETV